jgi:hypothetical protein
MVFVVVMMVFPFLKKGLQCLLRAGAAGLYFGIYWGNLYDYPFLEKN